MTSKMARNFHRCMFRDQRPTGICGYSQPAEARMMLTSLAAVQCRIFHQSRYKALTLLARRCR